MRVRSMALFLLAVVVAGPAVFAGQEPGEGDENIVIIGQIVFVEPEPGRGLVSEHDPQWQHARVLLAGVLRGSLPRQGARLLFVDLRFPASMDVTWAGAPKFSVGDKGLFFLTKHTDNTWVDFTHESTVVHYSALGSANFIPLAALEEMIDRLR